MRDLRQRVGREDFDLGPHCAAVEEELRAWGFPAAVQVKRKTARSEVERFLIDPATVRIWSPDFFRAVAQRISIRR